ncbi:MAG: glycosyltransferase family 4 protein [Myxococcales bacterium]|nr:glycosyltransferase family 4 protein [Myxococcales bacterium]
MRIALDLTPCVKPRRTGVGWYTLHLARSLAEQIGPEDRLLLCTRLSRWRMREHRPALSGARVSQRWFQAPFGPRGAPDVFHGTDARLPERCRAALVATVHDVFSLECDGYAPPDFRARKRTHYADIAERATRILFPSEATRRAYLTHFPRTETRARVVYEGVDPTFVPTQGSRAAQVRSRLGLPESYALYVGEISLRKNLPVLARALALSGTKLPWVWVGADSYGAAAILEAVGHVPGIRVLRPGYLAFEDLPAVYSGATLLTFATQSEGFGLPALEAMACGTPAVVANRGALPEITGGCALEADPADPQAIGAAIRRLAQDRALREDLRRRGLAWVRSFTWQRAARETLAVYRDAVGA